MATQQKIMYMNDWIKKLDDMISLNGRELLDHYGKISHDLAVEKASLEYERYKENKKQIEKTESLKELEADIKKISKN